jgi:uncharacterized membrane protein
MDDGSTGPAEVLAARFDTRDAADAVRRQIESIGYDPAEISYISDAAKCSFTFDSAGNRVTSSGLGGIAGGGSVGAAVSAGASALGLGSLVFLGPIGIAAGAAIGGVVGVLLGFGMTSQQATACEGAIGEGSLVMAVQTHAGDQKRVRTLLGTHLIAAEPDTYFKD